MRADHPREQSARALQGIRNHNPLANNVLRILRGIYLDDAPLWCYLMQMPRSVEPAETSKDGDSPRITVTLPKSDYEEVCRLARSKRVSNAWVIRDAVEKYIAADSPLFSRYSSAS
jgi:hypothetical protein